MSQKVFMLVECTFDDYFPLLEGDQEEINWSLDLLRKGDVILHSNEIGDSIGTMRLKEMIECSLPT